MWTQAKQEVYTKKKTKWKFKTAYIHKKYGLQEKVTQTMFHQEQGEAWNLKIND